MNSNYAIKNEKQPNTSHLITTEIDVHKYNYEVRTIDNDIYERIDMTMNTQKGKTKPMEVGGEERKVERKEGSLCIMDGKSFCVLL
jgi:hypothetical protein